MNAKEIEVKELYNKDPSLKKEDVKSLMEWCNMQPHLPKITELQAALFLHSCFYSNEQAKATVDIYFTVKTLCPDIFGNRLATDPMAQQAMNCVLITPLPKLTPEGDLVILAKMTDFNPENYNFAANIRLFDMITTLFLHRYGPPKGIIILIDQENIVFGHFLKLSVVVMKKFLYYLQDGMPIRLKNMQFFNVVSFMDKILAMMKPFMKKELFDAIRIHNNMASVFKEIPKEILPQEYGGSVESLPILQEKYKAAIGDNTEFFRFQESQVVDESKRPGKPKSISDVFGMEGTFKKLEVD